MERLTRAEPQGDGGTAGFTAGGMNALVRAAVALFLCQLLGYFL
ncbi:hypothetical protein [Arthrobacter sp. H14-L1]|nr:hypothetical protein [Arthrobacter sp. H14-L1]MCY0903318.1 hypothetical protein [Arthrobacter sp. H14-L1]